MIWWKIGTVLKGEFLYLAYSKILSLKNVYDLVLFFHFSMSIFTIACHNNKVTVIDKPIYLVSVWAKCTFLLQPPKWPLGLLAFDNALTLSAIYSVLSTIISWPIRKIRVLKNGTYYDFTMPYFDSSVFLCFLIFLKLATLRIFWFMVAASADPIL